MSTQRRQYLHSLTGLRGLATVYLFVYQYGSQYECADVAVRFANNGRVAISLSFVLSGFIMMHTHGHCEMDPDTPCRKYFWMKRWIRIMPCYLVALLINFNDIRCVDTNDTGFTSPEVNKPACAKWRTFDIITQFLGISTWLPLRPASGISSMWNPVSWAVQTELGFYFLFPFLLSMHRHVIHNRDWRGWIELLLSYSFLAWIVPVTITEPDARISVSTFSSHKFQLPSVRVPEFALGMLFGSLHQSITSIATQSPTAPAALSPTPGAHPSPVRELSEQEAAAAAAIHSTTPHTDIIIQCVPPLVQYLSERLQAKCDLIVLVSSVVTIAAGFNDTVTDWCANGGMAQPLALILFALASCEASSDQTQSRFIVRFLTISPLQGMGKISYCFYLIHFSWPHLLVSMGFNLPPVNSQQSEPQDPLEPTSRPFALLFFTLSLATAAIMHRFIEKPVYEAGKDWLTRRRISCECGGSNNQ